MSLDWTVTKDLKSGWFRAVASKHFTVDVPRLYAIFNDPDAWPLTKPRLRTGLERDKMVGWAFDNDSKIEIEIEAASKSVAKVTFVAQNLKTRADVNWATKYWDTTSEAIATRTNSEKLVIYSAPGKLNLYFKVGPLRADKYHEVASIYQAVDLRETVIAERSHKWQVDVMGDLSPMQLKAVPTGENNLVVKAALAVAKAAKLKNPFPVHFSILKKVPVSGGMGGGSADAAAAMLAVNELWNAGLTEKQLIEIGATIGADIPFAIRGGTAVGRGIGDRLESLDAHGKHHWALVLDDFGLSTPTVFQRLDALRVHEGKDPKAVAKPHIPSALIAALQTGVKADKLAPLLHNDLQFAAVHLRPDLQVILNLQLEAAAAAAIISGSGPTVAFLGRSAEDAQAIANRLRLRGLRVIVTSSPSKETHAVQ